VIHYAACIFYSRRFQYVPRHAQICDSSFTHASPLVSDSFSCMLTLPMRVMSIVSFNVAITQNLGSPMPLFSEDIENEDLRGPGDHNSRIFISISMRIS
jgi:hypothetical protein